MTNFREKCIKNGMGIISANTKDMLNSDDYAYKCMNAGYERAKKKYKAKIKKLKKKNKKLEKKLREAKAKQIGILKTIKKGNIEGLSFAFEPNIEETK